MAKEGYSIAFSLKRQQTKQKNNNTANNCIHPCCINPTPITIPAADERASLYGGVFLCSVVLPTISLIVLTLVAWLLIIKLILVVRKRRPTPTRGGFHVKNAYGILFDHEVDNCEHVEKGSLTTDGYEPAKASSSNN